MFPGPGAGSLGGPGPWRDKEREGGRGDRGESRQARAPPAHLLPRLRRSLGAAGARLPARPGSSPAAAGLVLPSARGSVQRRRVRGLRSGESPPLASARGARRRRPREREEARPGPRPDSRPRSARALARGRGAAGAGKAWSRPLSTSSPAPRRRLPARLRDWAPTDPQSGLDAFKGGEKRRRREGPRETALPPYPPQRPPPPARRNFPEPRADHTHRHTRSLAHVVPAETAQDRGAKEKQVFREYLLTNLSFFFHQPFPGGLDLPTAIISQRSFFGTLQLWAAEKIRRLLGAAQTRSSRTFSVWSLEI